MKLISFRFQSFCVMSNIDTIRNLWKIIHEFNDNWRVLVIFVRFACLALICNLLAIEKSPPWCKLLLQSIWAPLQPYNAIWKNYQKDKSYWCYHIQRAAASSCSDLQSCWSRPHVDVLLCNSDHSLMTRENYLSQLASYMQLWSRWWPIQSIPIPNSSLKKRNSHLVAAASGDQQWPAHLPRLTCCRY